MNAKKITVFGVVCLMITGLLFGHVQDVYAGTATVSVSASASNVTTGSTVTVTVGISADEPIGYGVAVSYDSSILEYQGGGDNGGGGTVTILSEGDGATSAFSRTLTFQAVGNGSTTVSASAFAGGLFGYNTGDMAVTYGSASITVSPPQSNGGDGNSGNTGGGDGNTTALPSGSGDNSLKSLEISPGTLNPAFKSTVTSYTVELPEDTKSIVVSAVPNDSKAKVSVSHNNDLEPGANKTYIVVTAENGTQKTYVLNINCGEVPDEDEGGEMPSVRINDTDYTFATAEQMSEAELPEGFEAGEEEYEGKKITVYTAPNRLIQVVYLIDGEGNGQWFIYKKEQKAFLPYKEYRAAANRYVIVEPEEGVAIPAGYEAMELEIQGMTVTAYARPDQTEIVLVYAMKPDGDAGFYFYDMTEETFLRYVELQDIVQEPVTTEETTEAPAVTEDEKVQNLRILLYVLCGLSLILAGALTGVVIYFRKRIMSQVEPDRNYFDYDAAEKEEAEDEEQ